MEINTDAYDCYVEELRYKGIPVDNYDDVEKMGWYIKYLDTLQLEEDEQDCLYNQEVSQYSMNTKDSENQMEKNFGELTNETLLHQLKDDVGQIVQQLQLVTQRIERIEDQQHKDMKNNVKKFTTK